jgi:hypothetical protein
MSQAPPQMKEWAGELEQALEEFVNNESQIKKIVDKEMQEGEKVIKEEKHELDVEGEVEHNIGEIKEDLDELLKTLKSWEDQVSNDSQAQFAGALEGEVEETSGRDLVQIEEDVKQIKKDVHEIKEEEFNDEIPTMETEAAEVETTYKLIVEADNEITKVDQMANDLLNTVASHKQNTPRDGRDQEIIELANAIESLREKLETQLNQIENEQQEVVKEIQQEEDLIWKEINIDKEELEELKTLIKESKSEDGEVQKLIKWAKNQGNQDYVDLFESIDGHLKRIEPELEAIFEAVKEMEEALEQAAQDMGEVDPQQ